MASSQSIATVYVRNLEERVKPEPLRAALSAVFSEYGTVIDIVAKQNLRAKGQAFVVFDRPEAALHAVDEVQGFELFDKPMHVALARTRSDATVKRSGNRDEFELHQRRRLAEKDKKKAAEAAEEQKRLKRPGAGGDANLRPTKAARGAGLSTGLKATSGAAGAGGAAGGAGAAGANAVVPDEYLPPNKILFVRDLPEDYDIEALTGVFGRFEGFREVRLVPGRKGIAFIEYEAEAGAITAKENTAGLALGGGADGGPPAKVIKVTYQRQ
ncbi:RNA recognition domain-containing protein [Durotheca rogersii]|uniref:RNA recognition domain-containing protein n=1 Tax=Durotheca rogersii TaxID=419775 RepID=UPI00221F030B|nr:RNA recognition domain-containing protein [Durotheca rogersii]KAI5861655.1 RNA recognition domain-containing protein [Durotheca rogersii]